ncbi:methylated-DNA--[protein]-cysteine S-methyltransferase [Actinoplanes derwentensis]|uniref:Methylated-DNA-[protein]-cysteine S-methyltransferase n=1 Tax=Actinoplanes derwentensis TaxID=113562 RepID=A0A1H2D204_9ACTN|nr:methylated-DNA--[protein]-cysteine S-methyltransferase [Actinoplanes derwentensis]GID86782.1 putative methylated-DNA:protein-cysteine methyltransferase [Actinoplanes derwentensis]SDT76577.1 methylated-DNA-[protein]-cysteine S-methyltransferase [Actinoplanes derwentensis]
MLIHSTLDTPVGPFTVVVSKIGAVRAAGFTTDVPELMSLVHPALREPVQAGDPGEVGEAVRAYLAGDLTAIDAIPVEQHTAGEFMRHAWQVMRGIKPGAPVTYTGFAVLSGRPPAVRAAAAACARNPVALFTPCHRVLRTDGSLGGYRWGLDVKEWLLKFESGT